MSTGTHHNKSVGFLASIGESDEIWNMVVGNTVCLHDGSYDLQDMLKRFDKSKFILCDDGDTEEDLEVLPLLHVVDGVEFELDEPFTSIQTTGDENSERKRTEWFGTHGYFDFPLRLIEIDTKTMTSGGNSSECKTTTHLEISSFNEIVDGINCVKYKGTMKTYVLNSMYGSSTNVMKVEVWKSFLIPGHIVKMTTKSEMSQARTICTMLYCDATNDTRMQETLEKFLLSTTNDIEEDESSKKDRMVEEMIKYIQVMAGCELPPASLQAYRDAYDKMDLKTLISCCSSMENQAREKEKKMAIQMEAQKRGAGSEKAKLLSQLQDLIHEKYKILNEIASLTSGNPFDESNLKRLFKTFEHLSYETLKSKIEEEKNETNKMKQNLMLVRKRSAKDMSST